MKASDIRNKFLHFFEKKGHKIVPSAPIVIHNDPTLMFTNAGMNQFKDYFLGNKIPIAKRMVDTQKCLRVSGKHNDLEEVGLDTYHHTMFEMLGNWSFGDYFKEEAIQWGWELLTEVYKLPKERLYATVFGGDIAEKLEQDTEAYTLWKKYLPAERILFGSKKDNFWEMGETGPCGPCSEIHIDLRSENDRKNISGESLVNTGNPLVVEIWNLVFIQYNRNSQGLLLPLPEKHVDTGMGLERLVMAIQSQQSNYDTDIFQGMIQHIAQKACILYGKNTQKDIAIRVISDHIRAISFTIADGQIPSNNKAGYVVRRILRRAVRYGYTFLEFHEPFLHTLVPLLAIQFEEVFPELKAQQDFVMKVIAEEENSFLRTLHKGLKKIDIVKEQMHIISGEVAFELYDTYGFPFDLTCLIARENNLSVDEEGFKTQMQIQKERSKKASKMNTSDWNIVKDNIELSVFVGYDTLETVSHIIQYREVQEKNKKYFQIVLDKTPFYAESGGQMGDTGSLITSKKNIPVFNTKKENELIIHYTDEIPENISEPITCRVDKNKRMLTENNHTATHLLHAALRKLIGQHVQQKGSLVDEHILRFDFSHFSKLTAEDIKNVERLVNEKIRENIPLDEKRNIPIQKAKEMGAMALFGEKYGDNVRVITFDAKFSVELCGGTHVKNTGQIGLFKIRYESSVAAGVRRIEATTAQNSINRIEEQESVLQNLQALLQNPKDMVKTITEIIQEKNTLQKQVEHYKQQDIAVLKISLKKNIKLLHNTSVIIETISISDRESLKNLSFQMKQEIPSLILILFANIEQKPYMSILFSDDVMQKYKLNANAMVKEFASVIDGNGGGQAFFSTAEGKNISGMPILKQKIEYFINKALL
ncbi:MAG: alanine--tRNA ligase [Chitinophagaceae bacterium]|nr:alanine--tRNA ligase [Chitinophagaceae bacterium]